MGEPENDIREVPLDQAMAMAIAFQRGGQLDAAAEVYEKVLAILPDHPDALHFSGVLAHQQGRSEEGLALVLKSVEAAPGQPDGFSNLGIIYKALGRVDEAVEAYQRAIALRPDHANAYSNLGILLKAQGKMEDAEAAYRTAIRLNSEHIEAYHNLGVLLGATGRTKEAVECYCMVTTRSPRHPEARKLLILAHCALGERDKATEIAREWVQAEPENVVARHALAACSSENVPARAEDAYVEKVFDDFASSFDLKLANLSYRAPQLVAATLTDAELLAERALDVLDAGCGTGLCGPLVAPYARRLTGVDLSAKMLAQAGERAVYDELVKGELTAYLAGRAEAFDLIVSADTLVYFGALEDVLAAAARALRPLGRLVFTLEEEVEPDGGFTYALQPHGRYTHQWAYVERTLRGVGLQPSVVRAELRMECGVPVAGLVVNARKGLEANLG
jgi:predicted TPR repeat methyltransferase